MGETKTSERGGLTLEMHNLLINGIRKLQSKRHPGIEFEVSEQTLKLLRAFLTEKTSTRTSSKMTYFQILKNVMFACGKNLEGIDREDLIKYFAELENTKGYAKSGRIAAHTLNLHRMRVKGFWRWLYRRETGKKESPDLVNWIEVKDPTMNYSLPKQIPTQEDIWSIINSQPLVRDKAMLAVLAETSCRVGELMVLNVGDVQSSIEPSTGSLIMTVRLVDIKGKTGERFTELYDAAPLLSEWLNHHPANNNPEAPLFVSFAHGHVGRRLQTETVRLLIKSGAKRAGIKGVAVNPHSWRHSGLTAGAKYMTRFELAKHAGHKMSSRMVEVYVHESDEGVANKRRAQRGLPPLVKNGTGKKLELTQKCPKCNDTNPASYKYCRKCMEPLDAELRLKMAKQDIGAKVFEKIIAKISATNPKLYMEALREVAEEEVAAAIKTQ